LQTFSMKPSLEQRSARASEQTPAAAIIPHGVLAAADCTTSLYPMRSNHHQAPPLAEHPARTAGRPAIAKPEPDLHPSLLGDRAEIEQHATECPCPEAAPLRGPVPPLCGVHIPEAMRSSPASLACSPSRDHQGHGRRSVPVSLMQSRSCQPA
jgi:hypothetical protein